MALATYAVVFALAAYCQNTTLNTTENDNNSTVVLSLTNVTVIPRNRRAVPEVNDTVALPTRQPRRLKLETTKHFTLESTDHVEIEKEGDVITSWIEEVQHSHRQRRQRQFGRYHRTNGTLTMTESGTYLVYSQLTYYDNSGRWCHAIKHNDGIAAKCMATEWGMSIDKNTNRYIPTVQTCYTSISLFLRRRDTLSIISLYGRRTIHNSGDLSFWGISRLGG